MAYNQEIDEQLSKWLILLLSYFNMRYIYVLAHLGLCIALHCRNDQDLGSIQRFNHNFKAIPIIDDSDLELWKERKINTLHTFFYLFGEFQEDSNYAILNVGLFADDEVSFGVTIDCSAAEWSIKSLNGESGDEEVIAKGELSSPCTPGTFDVIIKVEQRQKAQMLFNGEEIVHDVKPNGKTGRLDFPIASSNYFKATSTGGGYFTRYAFGKCIAYTKEIKTCAEAATWTANRAKNIRGPQGAFMPVYGPKFWPGNTDY